MAYFVLSPFVYLLLEIELNSCIYATLKKNGMAI
jgi:hypothetical protein